MEIQAIEHNELTVRFHFIDKRKEHPNLTLDSKYYSFRADLKPSILVRGTCQLIFCSIPPILTLVTIFLQNFVNVYYAVSTQNSTLISAFAIGTTFLNLFGYHIMFAFNNNLIALISQAHGARDPFAVGVHFQRGLLFQVPLFLLLLLSIYFSDYILTIFGFSMEEEAIIQAKLFIKWSAISVLFQGIYDIGRIYLCGQNHFGLPFYIKMVITSINVGLADSLIEKHGLVGLAIAKNVGEFVGIILLYVFISKLDLNSWIRPSIQMWTKWWDYFKFNFSGGLALYLHFLYIEILTIFVANLNDKSALNAHISFINLRPLLFAIPLGTSVSVTSFVGQSVGENAKKKAQTAALMGVIACNIYFIIQMVVGYWLLGPLKIFLSISDENEQVQFDIIFNLYIFFIIYLESHQFMFTGIMKGVSQLRYNLTYYIIGFYLIGTPLIYSMGLFTTLGLKGIWISYLASNFIVCIFQIMFFMRKDWDDFLIEKGVDLDKDFELPLINFENMNKENGDEKSNEQFEDGETKNMNGQNSNYSPPAYDQGQVSSGSHLLKK